MSETYDLAIAGSGFAGSLMAMIALRMGLSVVMLERGRHPRVVIGESSTPLSNLLLETIATQYDLPWLTPLTKWGTWQQSHPEIACGLKRGFTFFHHEAGTAEECPGDAAERQLLVAASPNDTIADTHWFRADFDHFLMRQAVAMGATCLENCNVTAAVREAGCWRIACRVDGHAQMLSARFLVDATGPGGLLHQLLGLRTVRFPNYPETSALYSHFTGVAEFAGAQRYTGGAPPYPPDAAALHHVFDGGWMWVLRFNNGWTSAGVATTAETAKRLGLSDKQAAWTRLLDTLPEVKAQFQDATPVMPFTHVPRLSFRSSQIAGEGWAMLPSAAGFVDPLLSTGFPLTLLGVLRLGACFQQHWGEPGFVTALHEYAAATDGELCATAELIGALYATMDDFATFRSLTLLYFAAASYAETARRLDKPELAPSFLLHTHPVFGPGMRSIVARVHTARSPEDTARLRQDVLELIRAFDVAGLTKEPADHCYPVRADDLFAGAHTVHATKDEIDDLLRRAGFYA